MIYVVATIELAPGMRDQYLQAQQKLLPLVRAEKGCVEYTPTVDASFGDPPKTPPRDNVVVMHEKWQTMDDLRAHAVAAHMKDFRGQTKGLVTSLKVDVFQSL